MKEILFKAKRTDNGEWIEGYLFDDGMLGEKRMFIGELVIAPYEGPIRGKWTVIANGFDEVDPDTICQFTGLCDKNGKKIWENDILMAHLDESYPEDATYETVEWNINGWGTRENGSMDREYLDKFDLEHFEVVGNIFDNKELLQGEHK
jgi:uncharacterized phage protein (TIGR01671 family)